MTSLFAPIADTSHSPAALLRPVSLGSVQLQDEFWEPRRRVNREVTLPAQFAALERQGTLNNFARVVTNPHEPFRGPVFHDSDLYKWLEAAASSLPEDDGALAPLVERSIALIEAAQDEDGYLNTYFMGDKAAGRFDFSVPNDHHEHYCAGHLMQAAVAHFRATGAMRLLNVARRVADHFEARFGPQDGKMKQPGGHQVIEMGLTELFRATGEGRYLELARFFVEVRGTKTMLPIRHLAHWEHAYFQDHLPLRAQSELVGHAVRALYGVAGATDVLAETGDATLRDALVRLWDDTIARKLYITGGAGARHDGESFGDAFELPNASAYCETCAAIALVMWAWRMLLVTGEARFAAVAERALFNNVLAGLSLDGREYFYVNPLEDDGHHRRKAWFGCACCPPNVARLLAQLPGYFYAASDGAVWVQLYAAGRAQVTLPNGQNVALRQSANFPWDGRISLEIETAGEFALHLRVPDWCEGARVEVNGAAGAAPTGGYFVLRRNWQSGDRVQLDFPMRARRVTAHPRVESDTGRVALMRGPLVYCLESCDHAGDVRDLALCDGPLRETEAAWLPRAVLLQAEAVSLPLDAGWDALYRDADADAAPPASQPVTATAIPYFAWANRAPGAMQIWLRRHAGFAP